MKKQNAFTLVELIIVIAIIAVLAGAIFVAIDPARRLNETRNARRSSDIATILDGVKKYQADNGGTHFSSVANLSANFWYQVGTAGSGCTISCGIDTTEGACVNLSSIGTNYLAITPQDPETGTAQQTQYALRRDTNGAITVRACNAEGEGAGGSGSVPTIEVTR